MFEILLISIGLVLIIEGILYFFLANNIKKYLDMLSLISPQTVKNISLFLAFSNSNIRDILAWSL